VITDLKRRGKYDELSQLFLSEYDCKEERWRILFVSAQSERMAGGATLGADDSGETWNDIAPETAPEIVLKIVCQQPRQPAKSAWFMSSVLRVGSARSR